MRKSAVALFVIGAFLAACGREEVAEDRAVDLLGLERRLATDIPDDPNCTSGDVDFSAVATDTDKCSGGYEYGQECCYYGWARPACKHSHELMDYQESFPIPGTGGIYLSWYGYFGWVHAPCDATNPSAQAILKKVQDARLGCTMAFSAAAQPAFKQFAASISTNNHQNPNPVTCNVVVSGAPMSHSCVVNACDTALDSGRILPARTVDICPVIPGTVEKWAKCDGTTPLNSTNPDGSKYEQLNSSVCESKLTLAAFPRVYTPDDFPRAQFETDCKNRTLQNARCLTGEDLPLAGPALGTTPTATTVQTKWAALTGLATSITTAPVTAKPETLKKLTQHRQLLFELLGEYLSTGQRAEAENVYFSNPDWAPSACRTAWTPLPDPAPQPTNACSTVATVMAVKGKLRMCDRMLGAHVTPALADLEAATCANPAPLSVPNLPETCDRSAYLTNYASTVTEELRKAFSTLTLTDATARKTKLQDRMAVIQSYYAGLKLIPEAQETKPDRWRDASTVTSALVRGAYQNSLKTITALTNAQQLAGGYEVDREILNAVLTNNSAGAKSLTTAPALFVLADALRPISSRLEEMDFLHDLGCRFKNCKGIPTEVSQTHALLGAMADPTRLASAVTSGTLVLNDWKTVFTNLSAAHVSVVQSAVNDALGSTTPWSASKVYGATEADLPVYGFGKIVAASREKNDNYVASGRFRSEDVQSLSAGLLQSKLGSVDSLVDAAQAALSGAVEMDQNERTVLVQAQLGLMSLEAQEANVVAQLNRKWEEMYSFAVDLAGLRSAATFDRERFGDFGTAYDAAIARLEEQWQGSYVTRVAYGPFDVRASQAVHPPNLPVGPSTNIATIAVRGPYPVVPGDLLLISATGEWSPTCAIQDSSYPINSVGVTTGPKGFQLTQSNGTFTVRGLRSESYLEQGGSKSECLGGSSGVSVLFVNIGLGSAQSCESTSSGVRLSAYEDSGSEYRTSATFNSGLRLPNTPFPEYPAGALLAVKVRRGQTTGGSIVGIEVVQEQSSTILISNDPVSVANGASSNQDVYLIPNEVYSGSCNRTTDPALSVTVKQVTPKASFAHQVQQAMATAYYELQESIKSSVLPQGQLLSTDAAGLQQEAYSTLLTECACDLASYEKDLVQLYQTWVGMELRQAERQVRINQIERQMHLAVMEWEALAGEVKSLKRRSEIAWLLPAWMIRNLDQEHARYAMRDLVAVVDASLYPFLVGKYPEAINGIPLNPLLKGTLFDPTLQASVLQLTTALNWRAELVVPAREALLATERVQAILDTAESLATDVTTTQIAIAFRKPAAYAEELWIQGAIDDSNWPKEYDPDNGMPLVDLQDGYDWYLSKNYPTPLKYVEASPARAERLWSALHDGLPAQFEILPEDIYDNVRTVDGLGNVIPYYELQLLCSSALPVIRSMGFYGVVDSDAFSVSQNDPPRKVSVTASPAVSYVGTTGPISFNVVNPAWTVMQVPVFFGQRGELYDVFMYGPKHTWKPMDYPAGQGLPASGSFEIAPGWYDVLDPQWGTGNYRHDAAIIVIMDVEVRNIGTPQWISNCQP